MKIPGYRILKTIGRGGMATVYLAIQESLGREVVLKTMTTADTEGSDFVERFLNEGRIIAALQHPHIITIYDIGTFADRVWIAMEYVKGGDLKSRIDKALPPAEALDLVLCIGPALGFAHAHGIIHRDVKPANILFREDGTPLLSDFGIAKRLQVDSELTSTGTILGSPFYMSPEQSEGIQVDGRTDIYSLGVIFYEMLTGERPYQGDTAIKVIMQHIQSPLPQLPERLEAYQPMLELMMAKNRDDRFPNTEALVDEADTLLAALTQTRRSTFEATVVGSTPPRANRRRNQTVRLAVLAGLAVAVAAGLAGFYAWALSQSGAPVLPHHPPPPPAAAAAAPAPEPAASTGAPVPGTAGRTVGRADVIKALTWLARNSLREDRLTQPPADNAQYYYSRLLALDPNNEVAKRGFKAIAERFVELAEKAYSDRDYNKALGYIALGLQVDPGNKSLKDLESFIAHRERTVLDSIIAFFRGNG